jgi:urocanate hydratase
MQHKTSLNLNHSVIFSVCRNTEDDGFDYVSDVPGCCIAIQLCRIATPVMVLSGSGVGDRINAGVTVWQIRQTVGEHAHGADEDVFDVKLRVSVRASR